MPLVSLVADFRALPVRSATFDVVLVCDNALPHLDGDGDIRGRACRNASAACVTVAGV